MAEKHLAAMMLQDLMAKYPNDFDGATEKIAKWKRVLREMEKMVEIARNHPDGWQHLLAVIENPERGVGKTKA